MSAPQTEEYLAARAESCRLLGLNPDNLSAHEQIRADLATVLRLWLDGSQSTLLAGGSADPVKLLSVVEALTKLVPEREQRSRGEDPRRIMFDNYMAMRRRGELAGDEHSFDFQRRRRLELEAEVAALKAQLAERSDAPVEPAPAGGNVVPLRPSPTAEHSVGPKQQLGSPDGTESSAAAPEEEYEEVVVTEAVLGQPEPWRGFLDSNGDINPTPGRKFWGPV